MDEKVFNTLFGARVRYYREKAGYTQKELADKLGYTSHTSIYKIECGDNSIPISKLPDFCIALNCQPYDLLGLNEKEKQIQIIAEQLSNDDRSADLKQFVEIYLKLLDGRK